MARVQVLRAWAPEVEAEASCVFAIAATGPHGLADDPSVSLDDVPDYQKLGDGYIAFAAPGGTYARDGDDTERCRVRSATSSPRCLDNVLVARPGGEYRLVRGASFASPHAAGVAALVFSVLEEKSAPLVLSLMRLGADDPGPPGRDAQYGFGRLNAGNSVRLAMALSAARAARLTLGEGREQE